MEYQKLCESDWRFMSVIWDSEPVSSTALAALCLEKLGWKKSTTYTVLRKLCDRGIFKNEDGMVTSVISREEFNTLQSRQFVEETFDRSLPAFLAAFMGGKTISHQEAEELKKLIDAHKEG